MRKRLYEIIEDNREDDAYGIAYNSFMMAVIFISIIPLAFKGTNRLFFCINAVTAVIFIIDYLLRWMTADYKLNKGALSFVQYPFTIWAIIDLISILPALTLLHGGFKLLRLFRMIRTFRVFRVFRALKYSKSINIIIEVMKDSKEALLAVFNLAIGYILVSALVVFNVEADTFETFFDAVYWATISLTTVGYGDLYPVTTAGRVIAMISSVFGIAIIALPSGIITAGFMEAIKGDKEKEKE